jgi:hypothetical protein
MKNYALINKGTNTVDNVIVWDGISSYNVPDYLVAVEITEPNVGVGWKYENGVWIDTHAPTEELPSEEPSSETQQNSEE